MTNNVEGSMITVTDSESTPEVTAEIAERNAAQAQADYDYLVQSRLETYGYYAGRERAIDDPRATDEQRDEAQRRHQIAQRVASIPASVGVAVTTAAATVPFIDAWGLIAVAVTVAATTLTGHRLAQSQPTFTVEIDEGTHMAIHDFRAAEDSLLDLDADPKVTSTVAALAWRFDVAVLALTEPAPDLDATKDADKVVRHADALSKATSDIQEIAARAWALVQLEQRHHAAREAVLNPVAEALAEAAVAEPVDLDFSEIDAAAKTLGIETADLAEDMDIDLAPLAKRVTKTIDVTDPRHQVCRLCGAESMRFSHQAATCDDCGAEFALTTPWDIKPLHEMIKAQAETFEPGDPRANMCGTCLGHGNFTQHGGKGACRHCAGTGYRPGTSEHRKAVAEQREFEVYLKNRRNAWQPGVENEYLDDDLF